MNYEPYIIPKSIVNRYNELSIALNVIAKSLQSKVTKQTIFDPVDNGVQIYYPCGTKRFIANSWYDDINTDEL